MTTLNEMKIALSELQKNIVRYELFYRLCDDKYANSTMNRLNSLEQEAYKIEKQIKDFCDNAVKARKKAVKFSSIDDAVVIAKNIIRGEKPPLYSYDLIESHWLNSFDSSYLCWLFDRAQTILTTQTNKG